MSLLPVLDEGLPRLCWYDLATSKPEIRTERVWPGMVAVEQGFTPSQTDHYGRGYVAHSFTSNPFISKRFTSSEHFAMFRNFKLHHFAIWAANPFSTLSLLLPSNSSCTVTVNRKIQLHQLQSQFIYLFCEIPSKHHLLQDSWSMVDLPETHRNRSWSMRKAQI
jgi:hypothetical protein